MSDEMIDPTDFPSLTAKRDKKKAEAEATIPVAQLAEVLKSFQPASQGITPEVLEALLAKIGQTNAVAMQSAMTGQNPNYVSVSPYTNPDGSRPTPKREVFLGPQGPGRGWRLDPESLTPVEIDLCNRFERGRKSARDGQWTADVVLNGTQEELYIKAPMSTSDQRQDLPPLSHILRELLDGARAVDPNMLAEQVAHLTRQLEKLQAAAK